MEEFITEAQLMEDDWDYSDIDILADRDDIKADRERRLDSLVGKYVISSFAIKTKRQVYLQDQRISKGGYWTQYLSNALGFVSFEAAQKVLVKYKYNNPTISMVDRHKKLIKLKKD